MFADDLTGGGSDASPDSVLSEYLAETVLTGLSDEFGRERPFNGNLRPPDEHHREGFRTGPHLRSRYGTDAPAIQFRGDRIPPEFPQFRNSAPKTSSVSCMYRMSFARSPGATQQFGTFATTVNRGGVIRRASGQLPSRKSCLAARRAEFLFVEFAERLQVIRSEAFADPKTCTPDHAVQQRGA